MREKCFQFGRFRALAEIERGVGERGAIYKAVCEEDGFEGIPAGTTVVLKVVEVVNESHRVQLQTHAQELMELVHPGVERCLGYFVEEDERDRFSRLGVFVFEWLEGESLKERLRRETGGLDADEVLRLGEKLLSALAYVSSRGIVHRDIKPGNIFLCRNGEVKLVDFWRPWPARNFDEALSFVEVKADSSYDYEAPEFHSSSRSSQGKHFSRDEQSDIFSLGVCLHEMLTGRLPYRPADDRSVDVNKLRGYISRWNRVGKGDDPIHIFGQAKVILVNAADVLAKALCPNRAQRYATFADFAAAFKGMKCCELSHDGTTWQLLKLVGRGSFGEVFKARDVKTGQVVAIKRLLMSQYANRLRGEARVLASLNDSSIVRFISFFEKRMGCSEEAFLVMEYLDGMPGSSLREVLNRAHGTPLPRDVVVRAFVRYAHGLSVMHAKGFVHRDIKPVNLYFPEKAIDRAAIMDLAIVRDLNDDDDTTAVDTTVDGMAPCTPDYAPPEIVSGSRGNTGMDIYALGLSLYEALSGKPAYPRLPPGRDFLRAFIVRAMKKTRPNLDESSYSDLPDLVQLVREMTEPDVDKRLKDAAEVERRLRALLPLEAATDDPGVDAPEPQTLYAAAPYEELEKLSRRRHWLRLTIGNMWKRTSVLAAVARLLFSGRKQHAEVAPTPSSICEGEITPPYEDARTITLTGSEPYGVQDETCRESDDLVSETEDGTYVPFAFLNLHGHATVHGFRLDSTPFMAEGGQGRVFKAECVEEGRLGLRKGEVVALKFVEETPLSPSFEEFRKAVEYLREIKSPHVPRYYGCFEVERVVDGKTKRFRMTVMEYLDGADLGYRVKVRSPMFYADEIMYVLDKLLEGLCELAEAGIVHRDVKPSNVFICRDGTVKLIDFDTALIHGIDLCPKNRKIVGTPEFAAPDYLAEGFRGDEISDVFSVGMTLYYMVHGVSPHRAKGTVEGRMDENTFCALWGRHQEESGDQVWWKWDEKKGGDWLSGEARPYVPLLGIQQLFERCLAVDRNRRFASFSEFRTSLQMVEFDRVRQNDKCLRVISDTQGTSGVGDGYFCIYLRDESGRVRELEFRTRDLIFSQTITDRIVREKFSAERVAVLCKSFADVRPLKEWQREVEHHEFQMQLS